LPYRKFHERTATRHDRHAKATGHAITTHQFAFVSSGERYNYIHSVCQQRFNGISFPLKKGNRDDGNACGRTLGKEKREDSEQTKRSNVIAGAPLYPLRDYFPP